MLCFVKVKYLISKEIEKILSIEEIRRQFVPSPEEKSDIEGLEDPLEEVRHQKTERLIHRYKNRAAFLTTDKCFAYCRYCFRSRFTGEGKGSASKKEIEDAAAYLKEHDEIKEVLLTGGDLFTLTDKELSFLLSSFKRARRDIIYRLCTRALLANPKRFTDNLFLVIEENNFASPYYLMVQFNHSAEIGDSVEGIVRRFLSLGIPVMNQAVLLKGVNDNADELERLFNKLLAVRIKPYYLFQADLVRGTSHMRVPLEKGIEIERELRKRLSGLAMPQYTLDLPFGGGKVPLSNNSIVAKENGYYIFLSADGRKIKYPEF